MAQSSGPISQGTTAERQFTDAMWRDLFGDEPGVVGDYDGTAYAVSLPTGSDDVAVGSASQASLARVAGFSHRISAGSTEPVTIPAASGAARTDIIALRYDPTFTGAPGPVRLTRIAGTSSNLPTYDASPPGVEDLPLWGITRQPGQALSQATVVRLFPRLAPALDLPAGAPLPTSSPLGATVRQGAAQYRRQLDTSSNPVWVSTVPTAEGAEMLRTASTDLPEDSLQGQGFVAGDIVHDLGGFYSGAGNAVLTVPAGLGGLYLLSVGCGISGGPVAARFFVSVTINGLEKFRANGYGDDSASAARPYRLSAGTTIGVNAYRSGSGARTISGLHLAAWRLSS